MAQHMLTTVDNPYNPFTQFDQWNTWDVQNGYHTLAFQARVVHTALDLSEADESVAIEYAIDEIVNENVTGVYRKVPEPSTS